jgi:hypothetical protein
MRLDFFGDAINTGAHFFGGAAISEAIGGMALNVVEAYFAEELSITLGSSAAQRFIASFREQSHAQGVAVVPSSPLRRLALYASTSSHDSSGRESWRCSGDLEINQELLTVHPANSDPSLVLDALPTDGLKRRSRSSLSSSSTPSNSRQSSSSPLRVRKFLSSSDFRPLNNGKNVKLQVETHADAQLIQRVLKGGGNAGLIYTDAAHCVSDSCDVSSAR